MLEKYLLREARRDKERSSEDQQIFSRKFDLHQYFSPASRNTKRFIYHDTSTGISHVHDANEMAGDKKSLVVAVDGACPQDGGESESKSSYGIFFGEDSSFNTHDTIEVSNGEQQTKDCAQLVAVDRALDLIKNSSVLENWRSNGEREGSFTTIIMTDSKYIYDTFTTSVWSWRKNGFEGSKGEQVVNGELIDRIDNAILDLAEDKVLVRFWSVPREDNTEAQKLANRALQDDR
ncbi:putative ribonuclease h protein [Botrytis fragariae]|uniref:ribonuclease H n=1 Tax=Botrytis fragariae TaxID=1964551 RepID=A0A8H6AVR2_9HELO|nr:putative ribonuclease h protein [Botrytis fragariae]KAF5874584.1 putative ribonuclease h protein [Botrytis fragariae]